MGSLIEERGVLHGRITVATHQWKPVYEDLRDIDILMDLAGRTPDDEVIVDNILCVPGLTVMVQALNRSAVEDQNVNMGSPFVPIFLAPVFGAVGTGSTAVSATDTALTAEVTRSTIAAGGSQGASATTNPLVTWLFLMPAPATAIVIAEAGVFLQGTLDVNGAPLANSGFLLDHALINPTVPQSTSQLATVGMTLAIGN